MEGISRNYELMEGVMKWQKIMQASQIERCARFLEGHPGFWPELVGEDAYVCGFPRGRLLYHPFCALGTHD